MAARFRTCAACGRPIYTAPLNGTVADADMPTYHIKCSPKSGKRAWDHNIWTGNAYCRIRPDVRIVRIGCDGPYYREEWRPNKAGDVQRRTDYFSTAAKAETAPLLRCGTA